MEDLGKVRSVNLLQPQAEEVRPRRVTREEGQPVPRKDESLEHRVVRWESPEPRNRCLDGSVQSDRDVGRFLQGGERDRRGVAWNFGQSKRSDYERERERVSTGPFEGKCG